MDAYKRGDKIALSNNDLETSSEPIVIGNATFGAKCILHIASDRHLSKNEKAKLTLETEQMLNGLSVFQSSLVANTTVGLRVHVRAED